MSSEIKADKWSPASGTSATIGDSGDTYTVPTGANFTVTDELKTNKISPASGTAFTMGDSGDTFTVPSGVTFANSGTATGFGDTSYYVKIANNNGTNSVGGAFINDCFSTTYRTYLVTFQFENDRNGNQIWLRFLKDDDTELSGAYYRYATHQINNGGTESSITANDSSYWRMTGGTAGGNTALFGGCFGFMYVHNPYTIASGQAGAGNKYRVCWNAHYNEYTDSGEVVNSTASGMLDQNDYNVAGIQFMPSANYIAKRNVTVWGLKEY